MAIWRNTAEPTINGMLKWESIKGKKIGGKLGWGGE